MPSLRKSQPSDIHAIMDVFDKARQFMIANGNPTQWPIGYPSTDTVAADIARSESYVIEHEGNIVATFCIADAPEPSYNSIDGKWINDNLYVTIHRIASDGTIHGVADLCLLMARKTSADIRIDTHADNAPMRNWITRNGFTYCGIIHVADGTPRLAYQLTR